jgi:hypothetical protein
MIVDDLLLFGIEYFLLRPAVNPSMEARRTHPWVLTASNEALNTEPQIQKVTQIQLFQVIEI